MDYSGKIICFPEIRVSVLSEKDGVALISIPSMGKEFRLIFSAIPWITRSSNMIGMAATAAAINYALFTRDLYLDFPISDTDLEFIKESIRINNTEVFVNRLCRRRYEFFRKEFLPEEKDITENNAEGVTQIHSTIMHDDRAVASFGNGVAVLSSGGKESLLSHGIFMEMKENPVAFFFNESGGHWRAAKDSYHDFISRGYESFRIWSNVDRFYNFMNRLMHILDPRAFKWADDYPVQLFTFPVYLLSFLPAVQKYRIGNIIMGNEFDDPNEMPPYRGIKHFYGIYDQSVTFQKRFTKYMKDKGYVCDLWSPIYNIYGSVVEDILANRYHDHYLLQRSCHSCHFDHERNIVPCGVCSKCIGVRMFIEYAGANPGEIFYPEENPIELARKEKLKLDPEELDFLMDGLEKGEFQKTSHITGIHILKGENAPFSMIPDRFRKGIRNILEEYSSGYWAHDGKAWGPTDPLALL